MNYNVTFTENITYEVDVELPEGSTYEDISNAAMRKLIAEDDALLYVTKSTGVKFVDAERVNDEVD